LSSFWSTSGDHPQKGFRIGGDDKLLENSQNSRKPDLTLETCENLANSFLGAILQPVRQKKKIRLVCCGHSILDNGKPLT
jgi:hypothetical protein